MVCMLDTLVILREQARLIFSSPYRRVSFCFLQAREADRARLAATTGFGA